MSQDCFDFGHGCTVEMCLRFGKQLEHDRIWVALDSFTISERQFNTAGEAYHSVVLPGVDFASSVHAGDKLHPYHLPNRLAATCSLQYWLRSHAHSPSSRLSVKSAFGPRGTHPFHECHD